MAATGELKARIQLLQAAVARGQATGKALKPELKAELDSYEAQGLLGSSAAGAAGGKVTEGERKTAFLATRLAGNLNTLSTIGADAQRPGVVQALVRGVAGDTAANYVTGDDRQRAEAAQADILDAALTLGTGAAYTKEQLEGYRKAYFPALGDSDAVLKDKRQRLATLLNSAKIGAGGAAPQIDEALKKSGFVFPDDKSKGGDPQSGTAGVAAGSAAPPAGPAGPPPGNGGPDSRGEVQFNDEGPQLAAGVSRLSPEAQEKLYQFSLTKPNATQLKAFYDTLGGGALPEANAAQIADYYAKGGTERLGVDYSKAEVTPIDPGDGTAGAVARGVTSNVPFSREIAAGISTFADNTFGDGGSDYSQNLDREKGYRAFDEQNHGTAYTLGAVAGSLPLGGVEFMGAREAARAAGVAAMRAGTPAAEARVIANRVFASRTAAEAAAQAGVYGTGNADGSLVDRLGTGAASAAVGAVTGGAGALAGGRFARALAARRAARAGVPLTDGQATLAAMERQNVTPFAPDVAGATTRRATAVTAQTLGGVAPLRNAAQATIDTSQAVRDRVAASIAVPVGVEETGEVARIGANRFIAETGQRIGRIYDQANQSAGRAVVETPEANRILAQELGSLEEAAVPSPGTAILQGLRDGLQTPTTVRGLRATRTAIRGAFENAGLRGSNEERIAGRVIDAATDDLVNGLRSQGLDTAARQYRVADRMWRERLATIDDHLAPILGEASGPRAKSGEQIVQGLTAAMQGNNRRFAGFISALPVEEQVIVRSSVISRLGQAAAGQQDQTGEVFSLPAFLTQYNKIGGRARQVLFGEEGRAALDDLATIASGAKEAQRYSNFSNTGSVVGGIATGASLLGGPLTTAKFLALQYGAGRLLASPRFARWLARPPRQQTPAATQAYIQRLSRIARSEPAIANEVLALQQRLTDAFSGAPTRLAADERHDEASVADRQDSQGTTANQRLQP